MHIFLHSFSNLVFCILDKSHELALRCSSSRRVASLCEKKTKRLLWSNDYFGAVHRHQIRKYLIPFLQRIEMNKTEKVTFYS